MPSPDNKSRAHDLSYLDPLQSRGGVCNTLRHIEAFGGTDFGVDQPLLEISQRCAEPLLQQALLVLTLSGGSKAQTGEGDKVTNLILSCSEIQSRGEGIRRTKKQGVFDVRRPRVCQNEENADADARVLSSRYTGGGGGGREMNVGEKRPGGGMAKWVKWKE